jgi:cell division protein FtsI/penicillin-binding protein 2
MIRQKNVRILVGILLAVSAILYFSRGRWVGPASVVLNLKPTIDRSQIAKALGEKGIVTDLPKELVLDLKGRPYPVSVEYAVNEGLSNEMSGYLKTYKPDYGAFVALDAVTGRILALISYSQEAGWMDQNLALRATFPSASVFKVVTAAAAISERKMNASSIVSFNGRAHTLYRRNLFEEKTNRWTTRMTLKDAFARSINTVFGKLGVFIVGPTELKSYAEKFGFNRKLLSDLPVQEGRAAITEDPWEIAEAASGYTKLNTMSPLQGALISAAIVNDGKLMEPYVVERMKNADGEVVYQSQPMLSSTVIDAQSAEEMKELMRETVTSGTSRGSFRGFKRSAYGFVDVGGKTGSLSGNDPEGKYDWFVGYGASGEHRLAVAALVISKEYWKVKSSYLARKAIEYYFKEKFGVQTIGTNRRIAGRSIALSGDPVERKRKHRRVRRHRR